MAGAQATAQWAYRHGPRAIRPYRWACNSPKLEEGMAVLPTDRHNRAANLSFADGHVEHWKWAVPKVALYDGQMVAPGEWPDYRRVQQAMDQGP